MKFVTLTTERTRLRRKLHKATRNGEAYVMTKSTQTLTQSGLLAVLLRRQRYKVIQLAQRRGHRKHLRATFWNSVAQAWRGLTVPKLVGVSRSVESFTRPNPDASRNP